MRAAAVDRIGQGGRNPARVLGGGSGVQVRLPTGAGFAGGGREREIGRRLEGRRWWPNSRRFLRGGDGGWGGEGRRASVPPDEARSGKKRLRLGWLD